MDLDRLPPLPAQTREAISHASDRATVRKQSEIAADIALESLRPIAAFAEELINNSDVDESPTCSCLFKIRSHHSEGGNIYVSARVRSSDLPRTSDNYMFVAAVGVELTAEEFKSLPYKDQQKMMWLGKTIENKDCYGVETDTESFGTVTEGYDKLDSIAAIQARSTQSILKILDIKQTVEYIKTAILSDDLNPGAFAVFTELAHRVMLERLDRAEQVNN